MRASPIRSASVNLAPAVPYHTPIRVRLSTPIVVLKKNADTLPNRLILKITVRNLASVPFLNGIVCFVSWSDGCCFSDSAALILDLDVNFGVFLFYPCFFDIICGMERLRHTFIRLYDRGR